MTGKQAGFEFCAVSFFRRAFQVYDTFDGWGRMAAGAPSPSPAAGGRPPLDAPPAATVAAVGGAPRPPPARPWRRRPRPRLAPARHARSGAATPWGGHTSTTREGPRHRRRAAAAGPVGRGGGERRRAPVAAAAAALPPWPTAQGLAARQAAASPSAAAAAPVPPRGPPRATRACPGRWVGGPLWRRRQPPLTAPPSTDPRWRVPRPDASWLGEGARGRDAATATAPRATVGGGLAVGARRPTAVAADASRRAPPGSAPPPPPVASAPGPATTQWRPCHCATPVAAVSPRCRCPCVPARAPVTGRCVVRNMRTTCTVGRRAFWPALRVSTVRALLRGGGEGAGGDALNSRRGWRGRRSDAAARAGPWACTSAKVAPISSTRAASACAHGRGRYSPYAVRGGAPPHHGDVKASRADAWTARATAVGGE